MTRRENHEQLYRLLRQSFGLSQDFSEILTPCEWKALFRLAVEQSVAGVCYQGVSGLSTDLCPPIDVAMQTAASILLQSIMYVGVIPFLLEESGLGV